jgi:hypothetical protein
MPIQRNSPSSAALDAVRDRIDIQADTGDVPRRFDDVAARVDPVYMVAARARVEVRVAATEEDGIFRGPSS